MSLETPLADAASGNCRRTRIFHAIQDRIRPRDLLFLALVAMLGAKVGWGVAIFGDVQLADETAYLDRGLGWDLPPAQGSPLYSCWYFLLSLIATDPIDLYFLNWFLLPTMLGAGMYLLVRSLGGAELPAFLSAAVIMLSRVHEIWPRPMHFAASLVMFGLAIAFALRGTSTRLAVATLTLGVAAYARPEFAVSFVALAAILIAVLIGESYRHPSRIGRNLALGCLALLPAFLLYQSFGSPLGGGRSDVAFGQHYAVNKYEAGLMDADRSPWHNYREIVAEDFGRSDVGPLGALLASPKNFLWHGSRNIAGFVENIRGILTSASSEMIKHLLRGYIAFVLIAVCLIGWSECRGVTWRGLIARISVPGMIGLAVVAPIIAACLAIYPREHYLLCLLVIPLAFATCLIRIDSFPRRLTPSWRLAGLIAGAIVLLAPNHYVGWDYGRLLAAERRGEDPEAVQPVIDVVEMIREIPLTGPLRVAGIGYSYFVYAEPEFEFFGPTKIGTNGFTAFLKRRDINVVVLRDNDTIVDLLREDPEFMSFRKTPPAGWVIIGEPGVVDRIAVRRDALAGPVKNIVAAPTGQSRRR